MDEVTVAILLVDVKLVGEVGHAIGRAIRSPFLSPPRYLVICTGPVTGVTQKARMDYGGGTRRDAYQYRRPTMRRPTGKALLKAAAAKKISADARGLLKANPFPD
jgi:hypothetical protein